MVSLVWVMVSLVWVMVSLVWVMVSLGKVAVGKLDFDTQIIRQINSLIHAHQPIQHDVMNNPG